MYQTHTGDDPVLIDIEFASPSTDLASIPETIISETFGPGQLLSLSGALVLKPNEAPSPVVFQFVEHRRDGTDVVGNSAVQIPEGNLQEFTALVNCPKDSGEYELQVSWGGGDNYIARAKVVVLKQP